MNPLVLVAMATVAVLGGSFLLFGKQQTFFYRGIQVTVYPEMGAWAARWSQPGIGPTGLSLGASKASQVPAQARARIDQLFSEFGPVSPYR